MDKTLTTLLITLAITTAILYRATSQTIQNYSFQDYKFNFAKTYLNTQEENYRRAVFISNLANIQRHNANMDKTYELGVNQFTDLTQKQFAQIYLTMRPDVVNVQVLKHDPRGRVVPMNLGDVDWTTQGKVSPVKNQGNCGSCWAFAVIGAVESAYLFKGLSYSLSEQQLVDCSQSYGNNGCDGGERLASFQYIKDNGINSDSLYPYKAKTGKSCLIDKGPYTITGATHLAGCDNLQNALNSRPVSVGVDASTWGSYKSGVLTNCTTDINHGVLLVGASSTFWKIKNSWGKTWGENGFIRIAKGNTCAICNNPSYPNL